MTDPFMTTILFSKDFVKDLEVMHRIAPTSIGVRRIRPSNKAVLKELRRQHRDKKNKNKRKEEANQDQGRKRGKQQLEDGNNRNKVENEVNRKCSEGTNKNDVGVTKLKKREQKIDSIENSESINQSHDHLNGSKNDSDSEGCIHKTEDDNKEVILDEEKEQDKGVNSKRSQSESQSTIGKLHKDLFYHQLDINATVINEEIAELRHEDRRAYNNLPVVISPPMTYQLYMHGLMANDFMEKKGSRPTTCINDKLADRWAKALHKVIQIEEDKRNQEDMRPLVYKIIPEIWTRLRSSTLPSSSSSTTTTTTAEKLNKNKSKEQEEQIDDRDEKCLSKETVAMQKNNSTILCRNIRDYGKNQYEKSWYNVSHQIVYDCLHNQFPNIHISCGSKFGCDYLLYDGCRMERHAFAGLRIVCGNTCTNNEQMLHDIQSDESFPLPTPYDLAGYVRVLNTAGKLALLAMVVKYDDIVCATANNISSIQNEERNKHHKGEYHVAIIDLALEKVITEKSYRHKRAKMISRKKVGLHLDKKTNHVEQN